ncbi:MAG: hypothetical protein PHQ80_00750 [Candidatus ainarchaeum sp.]|nr:hypothetical protein [Candidatus ainarchaeum sp.]
MNTIKNAAGITRRELLRGALASAALLALPSCIGVPRLRVLGPDGEVNRMPYPQGIPTMDDVRTFRDSIYALKRIVNRLIFRANGDMERCGPEERERIGGWAAMARTPLEVAEEYLSRCDSFLSGGAAPTEREGEYMVNRYKFAYDLLSSSIKGYARIMPRANLSLDLSLSGYDLDLDDL